MNVEGPTESKDGPYSPWLVVSYGRNRGGRRSYRKNNAGGYAGIMEGNFRYGSANGRMNSENKVESSSGKDSRNRVESSSG
ncbi:hypothetical protein ACOSP7_007190 [Xanthoceras sorbifolium]